MDLLFVIPCRTVALKILNSLDDSMQQVGSVLHFEMSASKFSSTLRYIRPFLNY